MIVDDEVDVLSSLLNGRKVNVKREDEVDSLTSQITN